MISTAFLISWFLGGAIMMVYLIANTEWDDVEGTENILKANSHWKFLLISIPLGPVAMGIAIFITVGDLFRHSLHAKYCWFIQWLGGK